MIMLNLFEFSISNSVQGIATPQYQRTEAIHWDSQ